MTSWSRGARPISAFLHLDNNPGLTLVTTNCDIRTTRIDQLRRRFGIPEALEPTSKGV